MGDNENFEGSDDAIDKPADQENYDDEPDETLKERIYNLTDMFPDDVVDSVSDAASQVLHIVGRTYKVLRTTTWIIVSSSIILLLPILYEYESHRASKYGSGVFGGPCAGGKASRLMRKPGSHPCQPFRPQSSP